MAITCRPAKLEDLESAERVCQESGNALRVRHGGRPSSAPPSIAFPKFCLTEDPDGLWVAEDGDTIVGFAFSWMTETFWFLSQLFVKPEMHAKGIGQALLSKALMQAERNGATNRGLITFAYNIASTGLYLNNGLYPREPLYRMAAPAQVVAQNLTDAGYDTTPIPPWPEPAEWMARIDQQFSGSAEICMTNSCCPASRARDSDPACGPRRRLCIHLGQGPCRPAGNRTRRRCEGRRVNDAALCIGKRAEPRIDGRSGTGGCRHASAIDARVPHRRAVCPDGIAAFRQLEQLPARRPGNYVT